MRLYPRISSPFANALYAEQRELGAGAVRGAVSHPYMVWPATGAPRIADSELAALRQRLLTVATEAGYPEPLVRSEQNELDIDLAAVLSNEADLTPVEAGFPDVWSFLSLVLVPELVWWRAAGSTNVERFVASDLTRHTLARLWWRAHLFTFGLDDPAEGWDLWRSTEIGEAELDQIQTRRGGYGRSPRAFRALVRAYPSVVIRAEDAGIERRTFWRQGFLRWVLRLGAFTNFSGLSDDDLRQDLLRLADELVERVTQAGGAIGKSSSADEQELSAAEPPPGDRFDSLPLSSLVVHLVKAVQSAGAVPNENLVDAFEQTSGIPVPHQRAEILSGIAWQAQALKYLIADKVENDRLWRPGRVSPAPDRRWGDWSITSFAAHVRNSNGSNEDELCAELFNGKPGRTVKRVAKAAMREALH